MTYTGKDAINNAFRAVTHPDEWAYDGRRLNASAIVSPGIVRTEWTGIDGERHSSLSFDISVLNPFTRSFVTLHIVRGRPEFRGKVWYPVFWHAFYNQLEWEIENTPLRDQILREFVN